MNANLAWFLGLLASIATASSAQLAAFPESWRPFVTIAGVIGTAVTGYMLQPPRRQWTDDERARKANDG